MDVTNKTDTDSSLFDLQELERETELLLQSVRGKTIKNNAKKDLMTPDAKKGKSGTTAAGKQSTPQTKLKKKKLFDESENSNNNKTNELSKTDELYPNQQSNVNNSKKAQMTKAEEIYRDLPFAMEKERIRLQQIEDSVRSSNKQHQNAVTYDSFMKDDYVALKIQRTYRGYLGRKKHAIVKRLEEISNENDVDNDWVEVRDRSSGDIWYYNKRTGISQWERPNEMKDNLSNKSKVKLLPLDKKQKTLTAQSDKLKKIQPPSSSLMRTNSASKTLLRPIKMTTIAPMESSTKTFNPQDIEAQKEINAIMGIEKIIPSEKLLGPDGFFKPQLRTTIMDAILESKFDSVANVIADGNWVNSDKDLFDEHQQTELNPNDATDEMRVNRLNKPMVSVFRLNEKKRIKTKSTDMSAVTQLQNDSINQLQDLTINEIQHPGFNPAASANIMNDDGTAMMETADSKTPIAAGGSNGMIPANTCFACWSAGCRSCSLHNPNPDYKLRPNESMLLCRNWELGVLSRRYRSEEIQEIFMKKNTSLRYDVRRKKFMTVQEFRHVIYRTLKQCIYQRNYSLFVLNKVKRWMVSFSEIVRTQYDNRDNNHHSVNENAANILSFIKNHQNSTDKTLIMRIKRARANISLMRNMNNELRSNLSLPPVTGYSHPEVVGSERLLFTVSDIATGQDVEIIVVKPSPMSACLFKPREYHLGLPKTIPMPVLYHKHEDFATNKSNVFIPETKPLSWYEKLVSLVSFNAIQTALLQIETVTPLTDTNRLYYAKQPVPDTVKFATIGHKPTAGLLAIGGLPYELLVYQLVTTYYPPQYGDFLIMEKSIINPGVSAEVLITFESIKMTPVKQEFIYRPVEHPLNYRRTPTVAVNSLLDTDSKYFYGYNRPEQTGEIESHGFRTTSTIRFIAIYEETDPILFAPSDEIVTYNIPGSNKSNTTHADLSYPFCEPSTRDNSTLDFYHLLLSNLFSFSKPQVFTVLTCQEPGQFLKESRDDYPMGYLVVSIYRSWAFVQQDVIEEFKTDDGVPYWYHRRTGETFWERPLYEDEQISPLLGGTILEDDHNEEPTISRVGPEGYTRRYLQGDLRKSMLSHHESDREAIRRRWNAAEAAGQARDKGLFGDQPVTAAADNHGHSDDPDGKLHERQNNTMLNVIITSQDKTTDYRLKEKSMMEDASDLMDTEVNLKRNFVSNIVDNSHIFHPEGGPSVHIGPGSPPPVQHQIRPMSASTNETAPETAPLPLPPAMMNPFQPEMLNSLTDTIGKLMSSMESGNPQDMIALGLGMGMAIMQNTMMTSTNINVLQDARSGTPEGGGGLSGSQHGYGHVDMKSLVSNMSDEEMSLHTIPEISEEEYQDSLRKQQENRDKFQTAQLDLKGSVIGGTEPIGKPAATIAGSANRKLDHSEESSQYQRRMNQLNEPLTTMDKARKLELVPTETPDIAPPKVLTINCPQNADEKMREKVPVLMYPELSTALSTGMPIEAKKHPFVQGAAQLGDDHPEDNKLKTNGGIALRDNVVPVPKGFYNAIVATHVARQDADYLPQIPNLPQSRTVGRVKPRSTALDWIAISFDPWSAGKPPVNSEFVASLSANASKFFEGDNAKAIDAIEMLRKDAVGEVFAPMEDVEGILQQRADISRAQVMSQDFKKICSLTRHNKNSEVEQLINQPDWSLPIDYQDEQGNTLLHIASQNGNKRMIKIFMRRGIILDTQNLQGQTALHYLCAFGYSELAEYLVKKGANDSIKNNDGLTCYEGLGARELSLL